MSRRIQVLGIDIDNHTIRESMFLLDEYVNNDGLNLVGVITSDLLMEAWNNPEICEVIEKMDMHVIGDSSILEVQEEAYEQQAGEIQKRELEEVFLNSLVRKRKKLFWISDSQTDVESLRTYIEEHYPKLDIAGSFSGLLEEDRMDAVINEINSVAPDVIFIQTADWKQLNQILQARNRLNARLCVCMGYRVKSKYPALNHNSKIKTLIDQTMFKRKAMKYEMNKE